MFRAIMILVLTLAVASSDPAAGTRPTSGIVTGRVTADTTASDSTRSPVAYANVILVGTNLGAMSMKDGRFTIQDVPPGTYTVRAMMMGFRSKEVERITVAPGAVATVDFLLKRMIVSMTQEIVVSADKPMVAAPRQASTSSDRVKSMPVDCVLESVALKAGIVRGDDQMHVRGGRGREVGNSISGVPVNDPLGGVRIPLSALSSVRQRREEWNTEDYAHIVENEFRAVLAEPVSTFSVDVDAASYSNMRRFVSAGRLPPADAVRIEEFINYFQYDYPQPIGDRPFSITTELAQCPWKGDNRLVHIGLQGRRVSGDDLPPANLVFLLDVSGSMQPPNKLPLLRRAFRMLVDNLRDEDRVAIVVYAGAAGLVLESTRGTKKEKILEAIDRLHAGGSTAGAAGIRLAYKVAQKNFIKGGNNRVILATDGDFNVGVSSDGELITMIEEKRESGVFLTVLGFGMGNIKDNKMEQLADHGNGNYAYIDGIFEARKVLVEEMGGFFTIAKDVKIQVEFNPAFVSEYRLVGYENRRLNREDFDDDKKDAGEIGAGHSVTALYEVVPRDEKVLTADEFDDGLKYMVAGVDPHAAQSKELLTVKFRYKAPDADTSSLIEQTLLDDNVDFARATEDFRFAAAVAEFGMLLRGSKFVSEANYKHVLETARSSRGDDEQGYRAEFVKLVELCASLKRDAE